MIAALLCWNQSAIVWIRNFLEKMTAQSFDHLVPSDIHRYDSSQVANDLDPWYLRSIEMTDGSRPSELPGSDDWTIDCCCRMLPYEKDRKSAKSDTPLICLYTQLSWNQWWRRSSSASNPIPFKGVSSIRWSMRTVSYTTTCWLLARSNMRRTVRYRRYST